MENPTVTTLIQGNILSSDQGNPAFCGVYLIEGRDAGGRRRVVFDFGHVGRRRPLLTALEERGLTPADVDTVVVSHTHWDHIQNADLFDGARVLLHADEQRALRTAPRYGLGTPRWTAAILDGMDVRTTGEGDAVMPGVRVVDLPGHTPGSIGLAVTTDAGLAVLTGDAVATAGSLRSGLCLGAVPDPGRADASVARVAGLADLVFPGHDRPFRVTPDGGTEYLTDLVPIDFRTPDPDAVRATVRFVPHPGPRPRPGRDGGAPGTRGAERA